MNDDLNTVLWIGSEIITQVELQDKFILDACCGGRMMWFDKEHPDAVFLDIRAGIVDVNKGRGYIKKLNINPDVQADFRNLSMFPDKRFKLVVCDPPHFSKLGETSAYKAMFGRLNAETWLADLKQGFSECWRVLDDYGVFIIKWNDYEIKLDRLSVCFPAKPLFGNVSSGRGKSNTIWLVFMKIPDKEVRQ